ncbi:MAG: T9SS type A sorting domain-containing protein [Sediminibacterium sp.]
MRLFMVLMLLLSSTGVALSQQALYRTYATQKVNARLKGADPALADQQSYVERFIEEQKKKLQFKKVTIPVVFHVIYAPGRAYPSEEQVYSQVDALNRDFSKRAYRIQHPADTLEGFSRKAEDMEIEFCLAKEGPSGKVEPSIRFIPSTASRFSDDDVIKTQRFGSPAWDTERYLNIWVASLEDSVSGYAQMPGGPAETDGIVIDYRYFGTLGTAQAPYNEGKTLTHLVGNYLGLFDLWGETPCGDDYVEDTPIHNAPNYGCPQYKHVSLCNETPVEMTMNFMDNTNDACLYMFTLGQKIRMQTVLAEGGPRYGLVKDDAKCSPKNKDLLGAALLESSAVLSNDTAFKVNIYPNPATRELTLQLFNTKTGNATITAFNTLGALQFSQTYLLGNGNQEFTINCQNWNSGFYMFHIETAEGSTTHRVVIARD